MIYGMKNAEGILSLLHELNIPGYANNKDESDDYSADDGSNQDTWDTGTEDTSATDDASTRDEPADGGEGEASDPNEGREDTTDYSADIDGAGEDNGDEGEPSAQSDDSEGSTDGGDSSEGSNDDTPDFSDDGEGNGDESGDTSTGDNGGSSDGGDSGTTDYSADIDAASSGSDGGDSSDGSDDGGDSGDAGSDTGAGDDTSTGEIDPNQAQLIGDASDQHLKNIELKQNFQSLYTSCNDILTKLTEAPKDANNNEQMERIIGTLSDLKDYIEFYITNTYPVKSYIDNQVNFQKYLTILNTVRLVLKDIAKEYDAKGIDVNESAMLQVIKSLDI